jgi:SAM-dependent methyltransferase
MIDVERCDAFLQEILQLNGAATPDAVGRNGTIVLPVPGRAPVRFPLNLRFRDQRELLVEYWAFHPRFRFFKTAKLNAKIADLGAATGGMPGWRLWEKPTRKDLKLYAVDQKPNDAYRAYDGFDIVDLGTERTRFDDGFFDGFILSHLIEHVPNRAHLFEEVARISAPHGVVYVEWPTPASAHVVPREVLSKIGIDAGTVNFFDDATHLQPLSSETTLRELEAAGFECIEHGEIRNDYLQDELFACAYRNKERNMMTYALWLAFGFAQYVIARYR